MSDNDAEEPNLYEYLTQMPLDVMAPYRAMWVARVRELLEDRVYQNRIPQHVTGARRKMDCAVYQKVGDARGVGFCSSDEVVSGQYQVDVYSPDDVRYLKLARAIRRALVDYSGPMGSVSVQRVLIESSFDSQEAEPGLNRRTQTYTIWYVEAEG